MTKEFNIVDFIISQTTPVKFDGGGGVQGMYDAVNNMYGGDAATGTFSQATQSDFDAAKVLADYSASLNPYGSDSDFYTNNMADAAARAAAAIAGGTSNVGGFGGDTNAWDMVPEAGGKGSINDQVNKQGIIDAYLAQLETLTDNLMGMDTSVIDANAATGIAQSQQNAGAAIGGTTPVVSPTQVQSLVDIIRAAGGNVVEGVADLGNLIFQAVTLGKGPQLEAVIPNLMDIINGGIGGTLVLGGGSNPVTVLGTGQTGIGRGTKVGVPNIPVIGPIINKVIGMHQQGATLEDIIKSIPSGLYDNLPQILSGAAAAGLLFDEKDKETLVGLGVEPSILGGSDTAVTGAPAGTGTPAAGAGVPAGTDVTNIIEGTDTAIKTGVRDIVAGGVDSDSPVIKTGLISDAELDKILTDIGGRPAVDGGYDTPVPEIKTSSPAGGASSSGGNTTQSAPSGGTRTVSGGPGPLVDIDYLYDFKDSLLQPFQTTEEDEDIVRAAEGGMIGNTNDFERILRIVRGI